VTTEPRYIDLFNWMALSRAFEQACSAANPRWFPAEGEEATIVGTFYGLRPDDVVAPHYRGPFVVYLMRGASISRLAGQALGKATGYARGRAVPFTGPLDLNVVPWVAGDLGTSLGVATGAALAFWYDRQCHGPDGIDRVVVVSFGDGTANRGDFHENINLAALWKLPIVYVCQNNAFAISLHKSTYLPEGATIAARAPAYGIPGATVDGNDVLAVHAAVQQAVHRARSGGGPTLIEAVTYRLAGHWSGDAATYRDAEEVAQWRSQDPLPRFAQWLHEHGFATHDETEAIRQKAQFEAEQAMREAALESAAGLSDLGTNEVVV
jgi:TPP-dependent pyruvate/acetoin dehydrogenase alpha subunit